MYPADSSAVNFKSFAVTSLINVPMSGVEVGGPIQMTSTYSERDLQMNRSGSFNFRH